MKNQNKIKALYLGVNRSYINLYSDLILSVIGNIVELDRFGPGFVSNNELNAGFDNWMQKKEQYDILFTDTIIMEHENIITRSSAFGNSHINFRMHDYIANAPKLKNYFLDFRGKKIFIANWDPYSVNSYQVQEIVENDIFCISFFDKNSSLQLKEFKQKAPKNATDYWHSYVNKHSHKVISVPHFINSREFNFLPLAIRKHRYDVPGANYLERKSARKLYNKKELLKHRINQITTIAHSKLINLFYRHKTEKWLNTIRFRFFQRITTTKMCYTSGGFPRYAVRKYFEIPARGAVLLCEKAAGFEHLGFKHNHNCIVTESVEEIKAALDSYNEEKYQHIADNGRRMVWELHSEYARTQQLQQCLVKIMEGTFKGSYWKNGSYVVE